MHTLRIHRLDGPTFFPLRNNSDFKWGGRSPSSLAMRDQSEGVARAVRTEERREGKAAAKAALAAQAPLLSPPSSSSLAFTCAVFARGITPLCRRSRLSAVALVCTDHPRMISTTVLPRNKRSDGIGCSSPTYLDLHCRVFLIPHLRENCGRSPIAQNRRKRQREEEEELIKMKYTRETDDFPFPSPTYCFQK